MKLSFVCPQLPQRVLPSFKTLTQSICYWISWCCPCPAISWAGWTQMQLEMVALGFQMQQGGHKGAHMGVGGEQFSQNVSYCLHTTPQAVLAWQIQLFRYLDIPGACLCPLLSHLEGEVCFQSGTISSSSFWQQNCICLHFWGALRQPSLINMCFAYLQ